MFYFNYEKFDFWSIYNSIRDYYPIGIPKNEMGLYSQYPGIKQLDSLLMEAIHQEENFNSRWVVIEKILAKQTDREVIGTTYGQAPSFSSRVILEKKTVENLTRYKELFITVSVLGPYYTVVGQDRTEIVLEGKDPYYPLEGKRFYSSTTLLTVSPENEYAQAFNLACQIIEERFVGYRFVPFGIYGKTLPGLEVRYRNEKREAIFHALFNDQIDLTVQTVGNEFYKSNDWIKEGYQKDLEGGWQIYPPEITD